VGHKLLPRRRSARRCNARPRRGHTGVWHPERRGATWEAARAGGWAAIEGTAYEDLRRSTPSREPPAAAHEKLGFQVAEAGVEPALQHGGRLVDLLRAQARERGLGPRPSANRLRGCARAARGAAAPGGGGEREGRITERARRPRAKAPRGPGRAAGRTKAPAGRQTRATPAAATGKAERRGEPAAGGAR